LQEEIGSRSMNDGAFLAPRKCLLEPIPEIWIAARLLREAVDAHLLGETHRAETLIAEADVPAIAKWTDSIWGHRSAHIHRFRSVPNSPPAVTKEMRPQPRMPSAETQLRVKERDGFFCRFCGIPVIEKPVRTRIHAAYPKVFRWGSKNAEQHAAFQCMWLQYDHVLPNSRGGESSIANVVVTCASCNFGRMEWTLEEVGLMDPRIPSVSPSRDTAARWNGLRDFI
jgi:5-methylcytosine-specific restriction endonuclease McrA